MALRRRRSFSSSGVSPLRVPLIKTRVVSTRASEIRYNHGVTILEINGRSITTRYRYIPWPDPVLRLPKSGTMNLEDLEATLVAIVPVPDAGLRPLVYVELAAGTEAPAVIIGKAETLLRAMPVRPAGIRIHRTLETDPAGGTPTRGLVRNCRDVGLVTTVPNA